MAGDVTCKVECEVNDDEAWICIYGKGVGLERSPIVRIKGSMSKEKFQVKKEEIRFWNLKVGGQIKKVLLASSSSNSSKNNTKKNKKTSIKVSKQAHHTKIQTTS